MNSLHKIIELLDSKNLKINDSIDHEFDSELLKYTGFYSRQAVCFYVGEIGEWEGFKYHRSSTILPYPVCWFECDCDYGHKTDKFGGLFFDDDQKGRMKCLAFIKEPSKDWMILGFCFLLKDGNGSDRVYSSGDQKTNLTINIIFDAVSVFLTALNCNNIKKLENFPPEKLQKKRIKKGKQPLFSYWTLHLDVPNESKNKNGAGSGSHASPRLHLRRGHPRQYKPGQWTWVQPCVVGNKTKGIVHKDYKIKKKEKKMAQGKLKTRQKEIDRIIHTSVDDAKSSLRFIHDAGLLRSCILAEMAGANRISMKKNIQSRIRQIEREQK